jgi:5-formyltetrahydrofolate cyclo-ligase
MTAGALRNQVYKLLMTQRVAAYPYPPYGHHPNFTGAAQAAGRLIETLMARRLIRVGETALSFPDYVLKPLRKALLDAGVNVVVPSQYQTAYRYLAAGRVNAKAASSIAGAERLGERIATLPKCRLICLAGVVFDRRGRVLGKGYGFRVPEAAATLPAVALCHDLQMVDNLPQWDGEVVLLATPTQVHEAKK